MARNRNYSRELAQRNAKAQKLGYSSYNRLRKGLEHGKVQRSSDGSLEAVPDKGTDRRHAYVRAGFEDSKEGAKAYAKMQRSNEAWSKAHSHIFGSKYQPTDSPENQRVYYDAFVRGKNEDKLLDMRHYLVDIRGTMTGPEFDRKYFKK